MSLITVLPSQHPRLVKRLMWHRLWGPAEALIPELHANITGSAQDSSNMMWEDPYIASQDMSLTHTLLLLAGVVGENCCDWVTSMGRTARPMETSTWLRCMGGLLRAVYCCTCSSFRPHKAARARSMLKRAYTAVAQFVMLHMSQLSATPVHALVSSNMQAHIHTIMKGGDPMLHASGTLRQTACDATSNDPFMHGRLCMVSTRHDARCMIQS